MSAKKKENLLSSWKEISVYLDCSLRTAKRWENDFGLPVYRLEENSSARVFAYKHELDMWLKERAKTNKTKQNFIFQNINKAKKQVLIILSVLIILLIGIAILISTFNNKTGFRHPVDFSIEGSNLVILDETGKELWRYDTKLRDLWDESKYREHFQKRKYIENSKIPALPHIIIDDINDDGLNEVLFCTQTYSEFEEGRMVCFDNKGNKIWYFDTGRELKYGSQIFSRDYRIYGFEVNDLNDDGKMEVIVIAAHNDDFPSQLAVLNLEGELIGEYWNSGRISEFLCEDLDNDGSKEIILAAMNNEYRKGSLIVLDSRRIEGSSPQTGAFRCESLPRGTEKYHILFPRTDADRCYYDYEMTLQVNLLKNKRLSALTSLSELYFEFNFELELLNIRLTHSFNRLYEKAVRECGIKDIKDEEEYKDSLEKEILYYDGKNWVSNPTMTSYWKNR